MSDPSDEFNRVIGSFVNDTKVEEEALKNKQQQQRHKCVNDAEAEVLRQHKASGESTAPSTAGPSSSTAPSIASSADSTSKGEDFSSLLNDAAPMPQTLEEAMEHLNKLRTMRDSLLEEQKRNNAFVERYKAKVEKQERMATLHNLVPRQLFVREDRYNDELEKVYKWSGISDQDIADIYRRKMGDIKQHGASVIPSRRYDDPYQNFRDVPDFSKVNGKNPFSSSSTTNSVLRDLKFMRRIAGSGNN